MVAALAAALPLYKKIGLRLGWGPKKIELIVPPSLNPNIFSLDTLAPGDGLPHIVRDFCSSVGVPRQPTTQHSSLKHQRLWDLGMAAF